MKSIFHRNSTIAGIAAMVASLFIVSAAAAQTTPVPGAEPETSDMLNTITVVGVASAFGEPNLAYIDLGAESVNENLATAFTETADKVTAVRQALLEAGVAEADLQTSSLNVYPEDRYNQQTGEVTGRVYRVQNILKVTVRDVSQIEPIISAAVNAGATSIYNLVFSLDNAVELEQQARIDAVANARTRAEQLAGALGVTVGEPLVVNEVVGGVNQPPIIYGRMAEMANAMPVEQGQLSVTAQVQITFRINR